MPTKATLVAYRQLWGNKGDGGCGGRQRPAKGRRQAEAGKRLTPLLAADSSYASAPKCDDKVPASARVWQELHVRRAASSEPRAPSCGRLGDSMLGGSLT